MIGDVVFFKKTESFISEIVANITGSEFTHVGLIVAYDNVTKETTIIESNRFIKTRLSRIKLDDNHVVYSTGNKSKETQDKIINYAYSQIGADYDYLQIFGLFLSLIFRGERYSFFNITNRLICSELIDLSYYKAGLKRKHSYNLGNVTPSELLDAYDLKEVGKEV